MHAAHGLTTGFKNSKLPLTKKEKRIINCPDIEFIKFSVFSYIAYIINFGNSSTQQYLDFL